VAKGNVTPIGDKLDKEFKAKLEEWGLTDIQAKTAGLSLIRGEENISDVPFKAKGQVAGAIVIPYYDEMGEPLQDPNLPALTRYRFLFKTPQFNTEAPDCKYSQPADTRPMLYIPPILGTSLIDGEDHDWPEIFTDPKIPLIITEGEMKSLCASIHGLYTVALGGVWAFRSVARGIGWLPELRRIDFAKRKVFICYDSDVTVKPEVLEALNALSEELAYRGASVYVVILPGIVDDNDPTVIHKCGLDDYIKTCGTDEFIARMDEAVPLTSVAPLFKMSERYTYINELNCLYDSRARTQLNANNASMLMGSTEYYDVELILDGGGNLRQKMSRQPVAKKWLEWSLRSSAQRLTYDPAEGRFIQHEDDFKMVNMWTGWGTKPMKGDIKPFMKLFNFIFQHNSEEEKTWAMQWFAYPVQHPGAKLNTAIVIQGIQGSGKTMLGEIMGLIYGNNYKLIEQPHLQSEFNGWADAKQFILGDEISGTGSIEHRKVADKLKGLITGKEVGVNRKNKEMYWLRNCINFIFTSNHADAFFMDDDDRRYFVTSTPSKPMPLSDYHEVGAWIKNEGARALHQHLLDVDLAGFIPTAPAPYTLAKQEMLVHGRSEIGTWVYDFVERSGKEDHVMIGKMKVFSDLWSVKQLSTMMEADIGKQISTKALSAEMKRAGAVMTLHGRQARSKLCGPIRLWAIRNKDKWFDASEAELVKHYEKYFADEFTIMEEASKKPSKSKT
jgi:hypothetical protein